MKDDEQKETIDEKEVADETEQSEADVPEAFQEQFSEMCVNANEHMLTYMRSVITKRETEIMRESDKEFNDKEMPS